MPPRWVTPEVAPDDTDDLVITVPNGPVYRGALRAFFLDMAKPENWESVGGIDPVEAAEWASEMLQSVESGW